MAEGWLFPGLRRTAAHEDAEIYTDDIVALTAWANAVNIVLRQAEQGLPTTDPAMIRDVIDTGIRIGILSPSPVKESL